MLEIFRRNLFLNSLLLLPITMLYRIKSFIDPRVYIPSEHDTYLSRLIFQYFTDGKIQALLGCFIVFIQAMMLNRIVIKNSLSKEITLVTGLLYITFTSLLPQFIGLSPELLANTFIIFVFGQLFKTYNTAEVASETYLSGFFVGVASLLYVPCILLILFTNLSLMIMRSYSVREKIQHFLGWITPFFLMMTFQYFIGYKKFIIPNDYFNQWGLISIDFTKNFGTNGVLIIVLLISIFFVFNINNFYQKTANSIQKRISILFWLMLFTAIMAIFFKYLGLSHMIIFCIPASYFTCILLLRVKNKLFQELIYLSFLLVIIFVHLDFINF